MIAILLKNEVFSGLIKGMALKIPIFQRNSNIALNTTAVNFSITLFCAYLKKTSIMLVTKLSVYSFLCFLGYRTLMYDKAYLAPFAFRIQFSFQ